MFNRKLWIVVLVLLALALLVPVVSATKPTEIHGYFDQFVPGDEDNPTVYCLHTGDNYEPDGFLTGCVVQPVKPGLQQKGTFTGWVDGKYGTCEYNLRTFDLDGIARAAFNRCTGDLEGLHMVAVGWAENGLWEGSYHFDPQ